MGWFNYYGLIVIILIMIPNMVFAAKNKDGFENKYRNKTVEISEQIGRFACFGLMIFNIPRTYFGFWFSYAEIVYIVSNACLTAAYCVIWIILWKKNCLARSILLSVIPSLIFMISGVLLSDIPLMVFAAIFAPTHILISIKNAIL